MTRLMKFVGRGSLLLLASVGLAMLVLAQPADAPVAQSVPTGTAIPSKHIRGVVVDAKGPVAGATVRVQATANQTTSDEDGAFSLKRVVSTGPVTVTAWAEGYYIGWTTVQPGGGPITLTLNAHYHTDNIEYEWFEFEGVEGSAACGVCHTAYAEWQADAHAHSARNPRFLTMYQGTDVNGNRSPEVRKNNLGVPLPPDLSQPYFGPGYQLDFPNRTGNCATCHTPLAGEISNAKNCAWSGCHSSVTVSNANGILDPSVSPIDLESDAAEGISCEFCHKVGQVFLDRDTNLPYPDLPGILSVKLYRPQEGDDLFFGPLDDIARSDVEHPRDVYLPLMKESAFCAGCHYGILGGVVLGDMSVKGGVLIYSSYEEWLNSPWSNPDTGKSCQECHMPPVAGADHFVFPERGGVQRDPSQIHTHKMLGVTDQAFMEQAATLTATATLTGGQLLVQVSLTNDRTGHHLPTDSPLRHVMLVVEATGAEGEPLPLTAGPTLPEWAGNYANQPGRAFAKVLQDEWSGELPSGSIWRPVKVVEDTRLPAYATDVSDYAFAAPSTPAKVTVRLVYRRAYQQLMAWKGWRDPDLIMAEQRLIVSTP
jgi:hypothetical protein